MQRIILHLDMNSYFASVEQQANPLLRGKPIGVCAYLGKNGVILASSIEAKQLGIKTGCTIKEARQLCPKIVLLENNPDKYRSVTRQFFKIMRSCGGNFEAYSIDEAFLDLSGSVSGFNEGLKIAALIRSRIKAEVGCWLKCAIGLSFTRFLAKFGSDTAGVDNTKVIASVNDLDAAYRGCKLIDLWGIGPALNRRLAYAGITTISQLREYPAQNLLAVFGKQGYYIWARVNGLFVEDQVGLVFAPKKSIGHSYCLPKMTRDKKYLLLILAKLAAKVGSRLRLGGQQAKGFYIRWSYQAGGHSGKSSVLPCPVFSDDAIFKYAKKALSETGLTDNVSMLAVGVFNLQEPLSQLSFDAYLNQNLCQQIPAKEAGLVRALDSVNNRFGKEVIYRGRMWQTQELAQDRIGFRKLDDI